MMNRLVIIKRSKLGLGFMLLGLFALLFSCNNEDDVYGDFEPFLGTWKASKLLIQTLDIDSNVKDTTYYDLGNVEFTKDPETEKEPGLSPFIFDNQAFENFGPIGYLKSQNAIDHSGDGRWFIYWYPDVAGKRVYFWGIGPGASYVQMAQIDSQTQNELVLRIYYDTHNSYQVAYSDRHILTLKR